MAEFPWRERRGRPPLGTSDVGSQSPRGACADNGSTRCDNDPVFMLFCIYMYTNFNRCLLYIFQFMVSLSFIVS
jgi:hypothetical protein